MCRKLMIRKGQLMNSKGLDVSLEETMPRWCVPGTYKAAKWEEEIAHSQAWQSRRNLLQSRGSHTFKGMKARRPCVGVGTKCGLAQWTRPEVFAENVWGQPPAWLAGVPSEGPEHLNSREVTWGQRVGRWPSNPSTPRHQFMGERRDEPWVGSYVPRNDTSIQHSGSSRTVQTSLFSFIFPWNTSYCWVFFLIVKKETHASHDAGSLHTASWQPRRCKRLFGCLILST